MPRYEFDPSKAQATIEVFPKDRYHFVVGKPKAFLKKDEKGNVKNYGIRFQLTVDEGEFRGKNTIFSAYLHNDGSQSMTKRFQMACLGYGNKPEDEKRFDAEQAGKDWAFDPDTGACGEAWAAFGGCHVYGNVDVGKNTNDDSPQQNFKSWQPMVQVAA